MEQAVQAYVTALQYNPVSITSITLKINLNYTLRENVQLLFLYSHLYKNLFVAGSLLCSK